MNNLKPSGFPQKIIVAVGNENSSLTEDFEFSVNINMSEQHQYYIMRLNTLTYMFEANQNGTIALEAQNFGFNNSLFTGEVYVDSPNGIQTQNQKSFISLISAWNNRYYNLASPTNPGVVSNLPRTLRFKLKKMGRVDNSGNTAIDNRYIRYQDIESLCVDMTLEPLVEETPLKNY